MAGSTGSTGPRPDPVKLSVEMSLTPLGRPSSVMGRRPTVLGSATHALRLTVPVPGDSAAPPLDRTRVVPLSPGLLPASEPSPASGSPAASPPDLTVHIARASGEEASADSLSIHFERTAETVAAVAGRIAVAAQLSLCNVYEGGAHYCGLEEAHHNKLQVAFTKIEQHCIDRYSMPDDASGFTVNWSKRTVRFFDPATNHTKVLDLQTMVNDDPDLKKAVDEAETLIVTQINKGEIRNARFAPNNKGSTDGGKPLIRPAYLNSLPKSTGPEPYKQVMDLCEGEDVFVTDAQRDQAVYRMAAVEIIINKVKDPLEKKIIPLQRRVSELGMLRAPGSPPLTKEKIRELQEKEEILRKLKALLRRLEGIDTFALYAALALSTGADANDPQKVAAAARQLERLVNQRSEELRLQAEKDGSERMWIPNLPIINRLRKEVKIEPSRFYPIDVGGLMFSGLEAPEARSEYVDYCRDNKIYEKVDDLEDAFMREFLRSGDANPVLDGLFSGITDVDLLNAWQQIRAEAAAFLSSQMPVAPGTDRIEAIRTRAGVVTGPRP